MDELIQFFASAIEVARGVIDSIPVAIWSGVTGALVTLFGVLLVNASNTKRLRLQLEHDAEQKNRDRLSALRREVYLQVPKEAIRAMSYLGQLPNRDLSRIGNDEGISGFGMVSAQASVLSDLSTVRAINALGVLLAHHLIDTLRELDRVQTFGVDVELRNERFSVVTQEVSRLQAEQQRMLETGEHDPPRAMGLARWIEIRMEEQAKLIAELKVLRSKHQKALLDYHTDAFERMPALQDANIGMMKAIRSELGLESELDEYENEMRESAKVLRQKTLEAFRSWSVDETQQGNGDQPG